MRYYNLHWQSRNWHERALDTSEFVVWRRKNETRPNVSAEHQSLSNYGTEVKQKKNTFEYYTFNLN